MTEEEARARIEAEYGPVAADRVGAFLARVADENGRQNLVSPSTVGALWTRHALDSAQLMRFDRGGVWLDIGTGGGFPGMIVAILRDAPLILVEPRRKRGEFLAASATELGLAHVRVEVARVEKVTAGATMISARAVASIDALFAAAAHIAGPETRWLLPRGRSVADDLAEARARWRGMFHVEHSVTDAEAGIVVAEGVERR